MGEVGRAVTGEAVLPDPAAFASEAVLVVAAAFADGAQGRDDLAEHFHKISISDTSIGRLAFAADGSRIGGRLYVYRIENGTPKFLTGYGTDWPVDSRDLGCCRVRAS